MSKNNMNNEIKEMKASEVVATCTMTEEEHKARIERIYDAQRKGTELEWNIMVELKSAKERHEQTLSGYGDTEADFIKWVGDLFEIKDTQVKQMSRLVGIYGSIADNGEWSIEPKYTRFSKEKLDIIQRHKDFHAKSDFDEIVNALGITPETSCANIKAIINKANGKQLEDKTATDKPSKEEKEAKKTVEEIKSSDVYKALVDEEKLVKDFVTRFYGYAKDNAMSDKDFRKAYIAEVAKLEKELKANK